MTPEIPNMWLALPEIFVCAMGCLILCVDLFVSKQARMVIYWLSQVTLLGAAALTLNLLMTPAGMTFSGMFVHDSLSNAIKLATYLIVFFVFVYSRDYIRERGMFRGEYFVLSLFGVVGMMIMASASHFLTLYLGLELLALSLYALVAFQRDSAQATEAAMKYFVLGAISSGILLYGMSILYGLTGMLDIAGVRQAVAGMAADDVVLIFGLVFVVVGIAFKLGAVPFHMWVPDVYHGAPTSVTLYIGTAPKIAGFALVMRLLVGGLEDLAVSWQDMLTILAVLSMAIGNVVAIAQSNIKRMLAYSSISHMGFFFLGVVNATPNGYSSALFYVLVYAVMSLGAFGMIILLSRSGFEAERVDDFKGLNQRSPWYAFLMLLLMFSMAGAPPTIGFYAKLLVIQSVIEVGMIWLAILAVLFAVIGAYYYIRLVKVMYFDDAEDNTPITASLDMRVLIGVNGLVLLLAMPWVGIIIDVCGRAVAGIY
ncbi:MAG: NADH-quinone oxidoreductase subunit NuoN [Proteobacteria bacterium]|nr:MAG: NADH-quinone oxidoreductase subunit NuoN [Pseudomonadota bacterium]TDJ69703.1 MAG: NADH-quinone oxidoreductase subunit NuoN [Pseudomonadota bacterium]